jgi:hypothetical protein
MRLGHPSRESVLNELLRSAPVKLAAAARPERAPEMKKTSQF